ncbi:MAG: DUF3303 family protein [Chromatiaceae bacterium]|nr:DUF3303 family protein [Gammaproteobacteria bacterium]MCP5300830.1 DUF3303 family protein [Chromatiaceae bacterium]MCP5421697.1 DUF3303 family protein [Chromatiaceae bacterium]
MRYMLCWSIPPENYNAALDAFLEGGAPMPDGLTSLGRWHVPGSTRGWLLCAAADPVTVAHHVAQWAGLLNIEVHPVIDDAGAGAAAERARPS